MKQQHEAGEPAGPDAPNMAQVTDTSTPYGLVLSGRGTAPPLLRPLAVVPPFPGPQVVPVATVPSPPLLDPAAAPEEWARRLAHAYRGAVDLEFGTGAAGWVFKRGDIKTSKHFDRLVAAARLLIADDIAPGAWCIFSCRVWRTTRPGQAGKVPPVPWVFSGNRLTKRAGWFWSYQGNDFGGRAVMGPKLKDLAHRYARMQHALDGLRTDEPQVVREVVERFFPDGLYDQLVVEARDEAAQTTASIKRRVAEGDLSLYRW
jgi:hypothetical protein